VFIDGWHRLAVDGRDIAEPALKSPRSMGSIGAGD